MNQDPSLHATRSSGKTLLAGMIASAMLAALVTVVVMRPRASARTTPARDSIPVVGPRTTPSRAASPVAPSPGRSPAVDEQRLRALEDEAAVQAALISNAADFVVPAPFPHGVPDTQREPIFRGVIEDAIRGCMRNATLAALSCDEPPCIAMIGVGAPSESAPAVSDCAAWTRVYGRTLGVGGFNTVECGNGRQEMMQVISPDLESWSGWQTLDDDARKHIDARYSARVDRMLRDYKCQPPART